MSNPDLRITSNPAERARGAVFCTDFRNQAQMLKDGWTLHGSPTFHPDGGMITAGAQYATIGASTETQTDHFTMSLEFYPDFEPDDSTHRFMVDSIGAGRFTFRRGPTNYIVFVPPGGGTVLSALAVFGPLWRRNERNLFTASSRSGAQTLWFNGVQIGTGVQTYTSSPITTIMAGATTAGVQPAPARYKRLYIGHHESTFQEHLDMWNNETWDWPNRSEVTLQMRTKDYDIANVRTLDSSGKGNHATLGDGSTSSTYPTQGPGYMEFDGVDDYLNLGDKDSFSFTDGAGNDKPFSIAMVLEPVLVTGTTTVLFGKGPGLTSGEYSAFVIGDAAYCRCFSPGGHYIGRMATGSMVSKRLTSMVATYNGNKTNAGICIYVNGVRADDANSSGGTYVAMENTTGLLSHGGADKIRFTTGKVYDTRILPFAMTPVQVASYHIQMMRSIKAKEL